MIARLAVLLADDRTNGAGAVMADGTLRVIVLATGMAVTGALVKAVARVLVAKPMAVLTPESGVSAGKAE